MVETTDVIVVGLGAMGAATTYQLAKRGVRVIGLDRHAPPHDHGSSHGETRITRQAIGEGEVYVPLALRSHAIWRELEEHPGELFLPCGFVAIDSARGAPPMHGKPGFVSRTIAAAERFGIAHELLTPDELAYRHPGFTVAGDERVYFEPGGGLVFPERCIAAQLHRATLHGADIRLYEPIISIHGHSTGVRVDAERGSFEANRIVVAAGGWTPALADGALSGARLLRQVLHWFAPADPAIYAPGRFPTFIWGHGPRPEDSFYGFPVVPDCTPGVKIATEQYATAIDTPEAIDRHVGTDEVAAMYAGHAEGRLAGLNPSALRSAACFYTNLPDGDFTIGYRPEAYRVLIVSACSGHGFKHSAGVGEHVARMLVDNENPQSAFALS